MMQFSNDPQVAENQMQAIIYYLTAFGYIDGDFAPSEKAFIREYIGQLVEELRPTAHRLGCEDELNYATEIVRRGPSYLRQREVVASGGTLVDVVDSLVEELRTDRVGEVRGWAEGTEPRRPRG